MPEAGFSVFQRGRTMLLVFLIAGPVVFGLLGAPLG
jgi:hypothetical protein